MAPPCFADLGKQARDLFNKNYCYSLIKLDVKTKTKTGVEFTTSGTSNNDTGRVAGSLETKYSLPDYGFTLKEKWNTDNTLNSQISIEDKIGKGIKLCFDSTFVPHIGKKTGSIKTCFKNDNLHINNDFDFEFAKPIINSAAVFLYQNWLAGAQVSFDSGKYKLTKTNFAIGYAQEDFIANANIVDGQEFGASMYQKVSERLETGVLLSWTAGVDTTRIGMGCVYKVDEDTSFRAKLNNSSQIGLSFTHSIQQGIKLTLSYLIDGKNFNQGGHKVGIGLDLEA